MSLTVAMDLVVCGVLLAGLNAVARYLEPDFARLTFFTGVVGGGLCILWGILGRRGTRCRWGAMATLAAVACVVGYQAVESWQSAAERESPNRMVPALMVVLVVFSVGMLVNLTQEGKGAQP